MIDGRCQFIEHVRLVTKHMTYRSTAFTLLASNLHLHGVVAIVRICHFACRAASFDESGKLHTAEVKDIVSRIDIERQTLLKIDGEDVALHERLVRKLSESHKPLHKGAYSGTLPFPLACKLRDTGNELSGNECFLTFAIGSDEGTR